MKNALGQVTVIDHPVVQSVLARLRDRSTGSEDFRILMNRISLLMAYEVTRTLRTEQIQLKTPLERTKGVRQPSTTHSHHRQRSRLPAGSRSTAGSEPRPGATTARS